MARHSADRDDLWAEVAALEPRGEWLIPGEQSPVTVGLRPDGRASVYFGSDPAYHFDSAGRLRRAFVDGSLYRSEGTTLSRLTREQSPDVSHLWRQELNAPELDHWLQAMQSRVRSVLLACDAGAAKLLRSVPPTTADWEEVLRPLRAACDAARLAPPLVKRRGWNAQD